MKISKKTLFSGTGIAAAGFAVLTWTDPQGQNWASTLAPFLLVLGYTLMGVGLILPKPLPNASPIAPVPPPRSKKKK